MLGGPLGGTFDELLRGVTGVLENALRGASLLRGASAGASKREVLVFERVLRGVSTGGSKRVVLGLREGILEFIMYGKLNRGCFMLRRFFKKRFLSLMSFQV